MFTFQFEDTWKKFPSAIIFESRFRGGYHYVLRPAEERTGNEEVSIAAQNEPKTKLGEAMRDVFRCTWTSEADEASCDGVIDQALGVIKHERSIKDIEGQYEQCKQIATKRDTIKPFPYSNVTKHPDMNHLWGITQQLRFGLLLREILYQFNLAPIKLDPVFACLLAPTGGVLGSPPFWLHSATCWQDGPLMYHRVCKDVIWYLRIYHKFDVTQYGKYSSVLSWYWITLFTNRFTFWY